MVLGRDIGLADVAKLSFHALVGKFSYWACSSRDVEAFVEERWSLILHYKPDVIILTRGWYCFYFRCLEDSEIILSKTWLSGKGSLMIKQWDHLFNPEKEVMRIRHLWVLIPNYPLFLWNLEAFTAIGNHLGRFLHVEKSLLEGNDRNWQNFGGD